MIFFFLIFLSTVFANSDVKSYFFSPDICEVPIEDWYNPTPADYVKLQQFLNKKVRALTQVEKEKRPFKSDYLNQQFYGWVTYRMNRGCLGKDALTQPSFHIEHFNSSPEDLEKCVICYASFPSGSPVRDYPKAIDYIREGLKATHFKGHFIYQIGGWPNVKAGRLKYVDVPFGFKPFFIEEIKNLGYKKILWLDACCIPVKNLEPIFDHLEKKGLCFYSYGSKINWREFEDGYQFLMPELNLSKEKAYEEISSQVIGINTENKQALQLLDLWIQAAERKIPFLMSDEPPFKFLVNHLNLTNARLPSYYYVETPCSTGDFAYWEKEPRALIYHQYDFLNPEYPVPKGLYEY